MSMILDALRKADSERERGSVPGLHAQPVAPLTVDAVPQRRAIAWHWIAIGLLVALLAALVWHFTVREPQRPPPSAAVEPAPVSPGPPSPPAADSVAAPMSPSAERPAAVAQAAPWPEPERRSAPAKAQPAPPPPEPVVYAREQLPDAIRAALPALAFGGSMYSSNPANRSLVVNGGLYRENDQVTADLVLEQIKPKAAVFRFRGYRFELPY